ncbi:MAG: hypothetical protein GY926_05600 [bacterium]|nr:hypothetical protein [bacterium]
MSPEEIEHAKEVHAAIRAGMGGIDDDRWIMEAALEDRIRLGMKFCYLVGLAGTMVEAMGELLDKSPDELMDQYDAELAEAAAREAGA